MSLLVSTQSYKNDEPTLFGLLIEIDQTDGHVINQLKIDTPVEATNKNDGGRLKPGLRGLYEYQDKIYTASWNKIFIIDKQNLEIEKEISHQWMSDLHGIYVDQQGIWVTSSYPDAVILYDFEGTPRASLWMPETKFYTSRSEVDKEMDWRFKGKDFRGFRQYHVNHVEVKDQYVYVTGRGEKNNNGRICKFKKEDFLNKKALEDGDLSLYYQGLFGPHDGLWDGDTLWVTETNNLSIAAINSNQKVGFRKRVTASEKDRMRYDNFKEFLKFTYRKMIGQSDKRGGYWTRGLCINGDDIFVGQSAWAGDDKGLARIVKIDKSTRLIKDCFYYDIPEYPEMRIYQIISLKTD